MPGVAVGWSRSHFGSRALVSSSAEGTSFKFGVCVVPSSVCAPDVCGELVQAQDLCTVPGAQPGVVQCHGGLLLQAHWCVHPSAGPSARQACRGRRYLFRRELGRGRGARGEPCASTPNSCKHVASHPCGAARGLTPNCRSGSPCQ